MDAALSNGGTIFSEDGKKVTINSEEWIEAWDGFGKWIHDDIEVLLRSSLCLRFQAAEKPFLRAAVPVLHTVYGKKTSLKRVFPQILPCVFMTSKNFQKFCAVSTLFFFLCMTYSLSIFYVNRMR